MNARKLFYALAIASLTCISLAQSAPAQRLCDTDEYEPAATTQRVVELPQFQLAVSIPSNYRTMLRQDGTVQILHPQDYEFIRCILQGGIGGRGYYSESIHTVARDRRLSLREQAIQINDEYTVQPDGRREWLVGSIRSHQQGEFSGYLVEAFSGYGVTFVAEHPRQPGRLLIVSALCDCPVERDAVIDLLSRMRWLPPR